MDDEILTRESIRDCIPWEQEGFHLCADAPDGELALPLIEKHQPDILITDIKMPFMDGLELSRIVKERMPGIKIIILSGHDEFDYACSALRLGVEEYCLKPVGANELLQLLKKVSSVIDKDQLHKDRLLHMEQIATDHVSLQRMNLLSDICSGMISTADVMHQASALGVKLSSNYYIVATCDYRSLTALSEPVHQDVADQAEIGIASLLNGLLLQHFRRSLAETVWILSGDTSEEALKGLSLLRSVVIQLEKTLGCRIILGCGTVQSRLGGLHASYLAADEEKSYRRLTMINRQELENNGTSWSDAVLVDRVRFLEFLKIGNHSQSEAFISGFASTFRYVNWTSNLYGYYLLNDLTLEAIHTIHEIVKEKETTEEVFRKWQSEIHKVYSWEDACQYLERLMNYLIHQRTESSGRYTSVLDSVKDFIHKNYSHDGLTLQEAAAHVNLSPSHLSKIFSQGTGTTFIEYLTQTRIYSAMELLMTTNARTYEIAFKVGYNDAHYFSNLFKKTTGTTTREFRKGGGKNIHIDADLHLHDSGRKVSDVHT